MVTLIVTLFAEDGGFLIFAWWNFGFFAQKASIIVFYFQKSLAAILNITIVTSGNFPIPPTLSFFGGGRFLGRNVLHDFGAIPSKKNDEFCGFLTNFDDFCSISDIFQAFLSFKRSQYSNFSRGHTSYAKESCLQGLHLIFIRAKVKERCTLGD